MDILVYILAVLVGVSLGLIGAGGSILTVPILVYVMGMDAVTATSYSLFIVGITSLVGAGRSFLKSQVDLKTAMFFGIPSILAAIVIRTWIISIIPGTLFHVGAFVFTKHIFLLVLFAVLMIIASFNMIRPYTITLEKRINYPSIILSGIVVGTLTGLVGAGGGFLIIPALVLFLKLPMRKAIGTSLLIITMNCLSSFIGGLFYTTVNWNFLLPFTACSIVGIFIGIGLSSKISGEKLKPAFGWVILIMGVFIIIKELFIY